MKTIADIAGNNAVHQLTTNMQLFATAVYLGAVAGPIRVGDANTTSARGVQVPTGGVLSLLPKENLPGYQLGGIYVYVPNGTTLTIAYDDE